MAKLINAQTGELEDLPEEQVPAAFFSQKYNLQDQPLPVKSPQGKIGTISPSDAARAFKLGYVPITQEEHQAALDEAKYGEGFGNAARAFIGSAASAGTLGLSDVAERAIAPDLAAEESKVRQYNPGSSFAGRLVGGAGLVAATGGFGAAAEGAEGAEAASGLAGVGARLAKDAAYGTAFGGGQSLSEAALGDHELTAEHLLSEMVPAALLGGATGLGLWWAGEALSPALGKAQEALGSLKDALSAQAESANPATSVRGMTSTWNKAFRGIDGIQKEMRDFNDPGKGIREREAQAKLATQDPGPIRQDLASRVTQAQARLAELSADPTRYSSGMVAKAQAVLEDLANEARLPTATAPEAFQFKGGAPQSAYDLRVAARDAIGDLGDRASFGKTLADANSADTAAEIKGIWGSLRDHLTNPAIYGDQAGRESAIRSAESDLINKSYGGQDSDLVKDWKRYFGVPGEKGLSADAGRMQSFAKQVADGNPTADIKKQVLDRMQAALQNYSDTAAESAKNLVGKDVDLSNYQQLAEHQQQMMGELKPAAARAIQGQGESPWETAGGLVTGGLSRIPVVGEAMAKAAENLGANPLKTLETLSKFSELAQRSTSKLQGGIRAFLRGTGSTGAPVFSDDILRQARFASGTRGENDLEKRTKEIDQYASNPDALNARLTEALGDLHEHAPKTVEAMTAYTSGDMQYLQSITPRDPSAQFSAGPSDRSFNASHPQRRKLAGAIQGVTDPVGAMRQMMATGMVNEAALAAVRARRPKIYDQWHAEVMNGLSKTKRPLGYSQKLTLSRLTGAPLSISMTPAGVASLQAGFVGAGPGKSAGATPRHPHAATSKMDLTKGLAPREAHLGKGP